MRLSPAVTWKAEFVNDGLGYLAKEIPKWSAERASGKSGVPRWIERNTVKPKKIGLEWFWKVCFSTWQKMLKLTSGLTAQHGVESTALCQNLQKDENTRVSVKHVPPCMEKKGWDKSLNQECRVQSQEPRIIAWPWNILKENPTFSCWDFRTMNWGFLVLHLPLWIKMSWHSTPIPLPYAGCGREENLSLVSQGPRGRGSVPRSLALSSSAPVPDSDGKSLDLELIVTGWDSGSLGKGWM